MIYLLAVLQFFVSKGQQQAIGDVPFNYARHVVKSGLASISTSDSKEGDSLGCKICLASINFAINDRCDHVAGGICLPLQANGYLSFGVFGGAVVRRTCSTIASEICQKAGEVISHNFIGDVDARYVCSTRPLGRICAKTQDHGYLPATLQTDMDYSMAVIRNRVKVNGKNLCMRAYEVGQKIIAVPECSEPYVGFTLVRHAGSYAGQIWALRDGVLTTAWGRYSTKCATIDHNTGFLVLSHCDNPRLDKFKYNPSTQQIHVVDRPLVTLELGSGKCDVKTESEWSFGWTRQHTYNGNCIQTRGWASHVWQSVTGTGGWSSNQWSADIVGDSGIEDHDELGARRAHALNEACVDTPNWTNAQGQTCETIVESGKCNGDAIEGSHLSNFWHNSAQSNWPQFHCCGCGKSNDDDCLLRGWEYAGHTIAAPRYAADAFQCRDICQATVGCEFFTFFCFGDQCCHLKGKGARLNQNDFTKNSNFIAGPRSCTHADHWTNKLVGRRLLEGQ